MNTLAMFGSTYWAILRNHDYPVWLAFFVELNKTNNEPVIFDGMVKSIQSTLLICWFCLHVVMALSDRFHKHNIYLLFCAALIQRLKYTDGWVACLWAPFTQTPTQTIGQLTTAISIAIMRHILVKVTHLVSVRDRGCSGSRNPDKLSWASKDFSVASPLHSYKSYLTPKAKADNKMWGCRKHPSHLHFHPNTHDSLLHLLHVLGFDQ